MVGDKIIQLNDCPVHGSTSWQECLVLALHDSNRGFCIPDSFIREHDESVPGNIFIVSFKQRQLVIRHYDCNQLTL